MQNVFEWALFAFGLTLFAVSVLILWKARKRDYELLPRLEALTLALSRIESAVHDEAARTRQESTDAAQHQGEELSKSLNEFQGSTLTMLSTMSDLQSERLETFATHLRASTDAATRKLDEMRRMVDVRSQTSHDATIQHLDPSRKEAKQIRDESSQSKKRSSATG